MAFDIVTALEDGATYSRGLIGDIDCVPAEAAGDIRMAWAREGVEVGGHT